MGSRLRGNDAFRRLFAMALGIALFVELSIAVLGTGSVGRSTLAVVDSFPEELRVVGLAAQDAHVFDSTVRENLRLAGYLTDVGIAAARDALRPGMPAIGVSAAYHTAIWQAVLERLPRRIVVPFRP